MKSQIQNNNSNNNNKKNVGIVELLTPIFFQKFPHEVTKTFLGKKNYGEVVLNWRTMLRFGRSFINDKCIFQ